MATAILFCQGTSHDKMDHPPTTRQKSWAALLRRQNSHDIAMTACRRGYRRSNTTLDAFSASHSLGLHNKMDRSRPRRQTSWSVLLARRNSHDITMATKREYRRSPTVEASMMEKQSSSPPLLMEQGGGEEAKKAVGTNSRLDNDTLEALSDYIFGFDGCEISPSSPTSKSPTPSLNCSSPCCEELVMPVRVCQVESAPKFSARVQHTTTAQVWTPTRPRRGSNIRVSTSSSAKLTTWKVDNDKFVFGYENAGSTLYVEAPATSGSRLELTKDGGDPSSISNFSSDRRVFQIVYNRALGGHNVRTVFDPTLWVDIANGFAVVRDTSQRNMSTTWSVTPL